jgi:hypothetical protein
MIAVRMMQASINQIIDVVAMRNGFVAAARTMLMGCFMAARAMRQRAPIGIGFADFDHVLFGASVMNVLQMAMIEIIDMVAVPNRDVAAAWSMRV